MPPPMISRGGGRPAWASCSLLLMLILALLFFHAAMAEEADEANKHGRFKRQYYDDSYYGSYYGWQAGRIIGWLIGFLVLLLFICVPCVCCAGIWFLGWFGLRQTMSNRRARRGGGEGRVIAARDQREIHARRYIDAPSPGATEQRYVYATDRYFERERRPRTPPSNEAIGAGPYASNGVTRETRRL